jgi:acylphosphatase
MAQRASIRVTGFVQGVYYRYATKEKADELGLTGTVRNMPDGSVAIVCEGERQEIQHLIEWCRHGPPTARVDDVEVKWDESKGAFHRFSVIY